MTGGRWDDERQRWEIDVDGEPALCARFVVGGFGGLNRPSFPDIAGLEDFEGPVFHTSEWDHTVPLEGKRVGVIGTGASAIQVIPQVVKVAGQVTVFQRTAPWVVPKIDRPIAAWEQALYAKFPLTQKLVRGTIFAITEGVGVAITRAPQLMKIGEVWARRHIRRAISDPQLRDAVEPAYRLGCKRILPSNDYYPALARDNVELVSSAIERVTPTGVVSADGTEHRLDVLVCGTGFRIEEVFTHLDIRGRDGITLTRGLGRRDRGAPRHDGPRIPESGAAVRAQHGHRQHLAGLHDRSSDPLRARDAADPARARRGDDRASGRSSVRLQPVAAAQHAADRVADRWLRQLVPRRRGRQPHAVPGTVVVVLALAAPSAGGRV